MSEGFRWELPLRLFHWSLALAVSLALFSGWQGGAWMSLHALAGYTILGLLALRLVWGFVGPAPSRWRALLRAATGRAGEAGHSRQGAWSVLFVLGLLAAQALGGLFANDEIGFEAPLATWVGEDFSLRITGWHRLASDAVWVWIALHLGALLFYRLLRKTALWRRMALRAWQAGLLLALAGAAAGVGLLESGAWSMAEPAPPARPAPGGQPAW